MGWLRYLGPRRRMTSWAAVVTGATEHETLGRLLDYQATEHVHRDLCVLPKGKKP